MALGTPVAGTVIYSAQNGTSVAPTYPASIVATDTLVLVLGMKPSTANGGTVTTPTGWTLRDSLTGAGGYGATLGADTGNTNLYIYTKDVVTAGLSGAVTVTVATNNVSWAVITRVPSTNGAFSYGAADGSRTTAPTANVAFGVTLTDGSPTTAFQSGDVALWAMCIPTDVTTPAQFTAFTMAATGATFAAGVELREPDSATGNDIGGYLAYANCTAGSSSTAPTATVTASGTVTNVRGPIVALRIREIAGAAQNLTPSLFTNTNEFFSATVSQVAPVQDLTAALYTNTISFFSATVSGLNTVVPALYDNITVFYTPSITQVGPDQTLTAARYDNVNVFYSPLLEQSGGTQELTAALFSNTQTFYAPAVAATVSLIPALFTNTQTFYAPAAATTVSLVPALFTNTQTFYAPSVTTTNTLAASLFTNSQTFYSPTATSLNIIAPPMFADSDFIFPPVVTQVGDAQALTASLFTNSNTFFAASIGDTPVQPILSGGTVTKPRRKFRPAILIDLPEEEKALPDLNAQVKLAGLSATLAVGSVVATSPDPMDARASLAFTQIETYMRGVTAESSWNDPSDEELLFILDFALT